MFRPWISLDRVVVTLVLGVVLAACGDGSTADAGADGSPPPDAAADGAAPDAGEDAGVRDSGVGPGEPESIARLPGNPQLAIAINATDVYVGTNAGIVRVPVDGTPSTTITVAGARTQKGLAVDETHVYWAGGGGVHRTTLAGEEHLELTSAESPSFMAVNTDYVFWGDLAGGNRQIWRSDKEGTSVMTLVGSDEVSLPWVMAADESHLYWVDRGSPASIRRVGVDGTGATTLAAGTGAAMLAIDDTHVYFGAAGIYRMRKDGSELTLLASGTAAGLAVDADAVYWVDLGGAIFKVLKDGSGLALLGSITGTPGALAVNGAAGYVIAQGSTGQLYRFGK